MGLGHRGMTLTAPQATSCAPLVGWTPALPRGCPAHPLSAARGHILARVRREDRGHSTPCWIWQGALNYKGYGVGHPGGKWSRIHRVTYVEYVGPIPDGLQIDHLCRVKACCNPDHLEAVTAGENLRRAWADRPRRPSKPRLFTRPRKNGIITHCKRGHELTPENTMTAGSGKRACRICAYAIAKPRKARWRAKRRAERDALRHARADRPSLAHAES